MTSRRSAIVAFVAVLTLLHGSAVSTQSGGSPYFVTDLGTLGGAESGATAINVFGNVAGWALRSDGAEHAFFFDNTLHDLGTIGGPSSAAWGVNRFGTVVGQSTTVLSNLKAVIWSGGGRRSLGTFGGSAAAAYAVNDAGDVVGTANTTNNVANRAFLYRNGTMKSLGTLGGANSVATAINYVGEVAGFSTLTANSDVTHAFLYRNGMMTDIGTLGTESDAWALNIDAWVVGRSRLASGDTHAFLFRDGAMIDLGTLGGRNSVAKSIGPFSGQIVGESEVTGATGTHAFLYQDGAMIDLNTRLPPGSGWVLESATAINDVGEIAGVGTINGRRHAFLLTVPVRMQLFSFGVFGDDSNLPRGGVQVGRRVRFVTSVQLANDTTAHQVVLTDTFSGPVTIESIRTAREAASCKVVGLVVTCRIPELGEQSSIASSDELAVTVRVNAPGVFSHVAHATAANAEPSPDTDTVREENIGIALKSFTLSQATVAGGTAVSARVELTSPPNPGGNFIQLESSNPAIAPVPSPFAAQESPVRTFNIIPPVVSQPTSATVSATFGLVTISQTLTVVPPALGTLSLTRSTMIGSCQTAVAKVTLTGDAPASGASVALSSTTAGVHVPLTLTVAPGATTASVSVSADAVHVLTKGVFTAAFGGVTRQLPLAVRPIFLTAVTLTPSAVRGGAAVNGAAAIECAAPAGGLAATVTSTNSAAGGPTAGTLLFPAGSTSIPFVVQTKPVAAAATTSIRVTVNAVTKSAALSVNP